MTHLFNVKLYCTLIKHIPQTPGRSWGKANLTLYNCLWAATLYSSMTPSSSSTSESVASAGPGDTGSAGAAGVACCGVLTFIHLVSVDTTPVFVSIPLTCTCTVHTILFVTNNTDSFNYDQNKLEPLGRCNGNTPKRCWRLADMKHGTPDLSLALYPLYHAAPIKYKRCTFVQLKVDWFCLYFQ